MVHSAKWLSSSAVRSTLEPKYDTERENDFQLAEAGKRHVPVLTEPRLCLDRAKTSSTSFVYTPSVSGFNEGWHWMGVRSAPSSAQCLAPTPPTPPGECSSSRSQPRTDTLHGPQTETRTHCSRTAPGEEGLSKPGSPGSARSSGFG